MESPPELSQADLLRILTAFREMADACTEPAMDRVVPRLLEITAKATDSDRSAIFLLEPDRDELVLAGDYPGASDLARRYQRMPATGTTTGTVMRSLAARAFHARDIAKTAPDLERAGFVEIAIVPLHIQGRPAGTVQLVRDTPRPYEADDLRRADILAGQLAVLLENARLYSDSQRRIGDLSLINELGGMISGQLELPALLSAGVHQLCRIVGVESVTLLLLDAAGTHLRAEAAVHDGATREFAIRLDERSAATICFHERAPLIIDDTSTDARAHPELWRQFELSSVMAAPLLTRGEAIGVVALGIRDPERRFSRAELDRTVLVANLLAGAISNARLFERERQRVRDLSLLSDVARAVSATLDREVLLADCLERVCAALEFEGVAFLVGPAAKEIAPIARRGYAEDGDAAAVALCLRAIAEGEPRCDGVDSAAHHRCAIPLRAGEDSVGVLFLQRRGRAVAAADLAILAAAAPEIAVGLENCRLFAEAKRRVEEFKLLVDVGRAVTTSLDLDRILETSAGILTQMIDASNSFILLLDADRKMLRGVATSNPARREQFRTVCIPYDAVSIAARCVRTRSTIVIQDAGGSTEVNKALVELYAEKSLLALPLMVRDQAIGVVVIDETRAMRSWTRSEIERAEVVAHQIAVAVANARLFDDLKQSYGELARAQEELVKRERLAALGELAAIMAHEVRNPLGVIFNSLGTLGRILRPTADAAMLLTIVREEADRLNHLVGDLLDFAKPKTPATTPESLQSVIEGAVEAATSEPTSSDIRVCTEVAPDLPPVDIDARMMRRALVNLVLNGLQAMSHGGVLTVRASTERRGDRSLARVDVIDEGPGIAPEVVPYMFQPFFTTKASGTGLGLAVVKSIVDAHRGELSVDSRLGHGTTFTVRLPIEKAATPSVAGW